MVYGAPGLRAVPPVSAVLRFPGVAPAPGGARVFPFLAEADPSSTAGASAMRAGVELPTASRRPGPV